MTGFGNSFGLGDEKEENVKKDYKMCICNGNQLTGFLYIVGYICFEIREEGRLGCGFKFLDACFFKHLYESTEHRGQDPRSTITKNDIK